jgi:hypothetical protein
MGQPASVGALAPPAECIGRAEGTGGTETSQYPEEEKSTGGRREPVSTFSPVWGGRERPVVVASEAGRSPNRCGFAQDGVGGRCQFKRHGPLGGRSRWKAAPQGVRVP